MASLPFKRLHPHQSAKTCTPDPTVAETKRPPHRYRVLYRQAKRGKQASWRGDGILDILSSGNALLTDSDTGEVLAQQKIPSQRLPLQTHKPIFMADMMLQVQSDFAGERHTREDTSAKMSLRQSVIMSEASRRPYTKPKARVALAPALTCPCEGCRAKGLDCDFSRPCTPCVTDKASYCSYVNPSFTAIHRTPVLPNADDRTITNACHNCVIFRVECDHANPYVPCVQCISRRRAFCTQVDHSGTVISTLCAAYTHFNDQVILKPDYRGDRDEVWPLWPPSQPSPSIISRLDKRFGPSRASRAMDDGSTNHYHGSSFPTFMGYP